MDAASLAAIVVVLVGVFLLMNFPAVPSDGSSGFASAAPGLQALAQAIARQENVSPSANNPGALVLGDQGSGVLNSAGVTIFATAAAGWDALMRELTLVENGASKYLSPSMTLAQFAQVWTGGDKATAWADNVASFLGVTPDTTISQIIGGGQ